VVFKHSTQCSISAAALEELEEFMSTHPGIACGMLLVLEHRRVSDAVESRFSIRHESPQAFVFMNGQPVWHRSHRGITSEALARALGSSGGNN
jgi:bacillithiol system protein YtxJ